MRLRLIERVDFRKSELSNYLEHVKDKDKKLGKDDVALFISQSGNQLVFVYGFTDMDEKKKVLRSERLRITGGTWNPLMLQNYAERVGLHLDGLRRFEQHYRRLAEVSSPSPIEVEVSQVAN